MKVQGHHGPKGFKNPFGLYLLQHTERDNVLIIDKMHFSNFQLGSIKMYLPIPAGTFWYM